MSFKKSFYFLRHGETDWNVKKRLQGHMDIPLNVKGEEQASNVAEFFTKLPIDVAISSDSCRANTTANRALSLTSIPIYKHSGIREWFFGDWEGRLASEIKEELGLPQGLFIRLDITPPNGESWEEFRDRVISSVEELLNQHEGEVLLVAHGFVFIVLTMMLLDENTMCDNCVPYHFIKQSNTWKLKKLV